MTDKSGWREVYDGGGLDAETAIFLSLANEMAQVQEINRQKAGGPHPERTLHAKITVGVTNAALIVAPELPAGLATSYFQPGASFPAAVRFSNASGVPQADGVPDMRGAAIKLTLPTGGAHDLLMTSFPVSHARNARQFVAFAMIASGPWDAMAARLVETFGEAETKRMMANVMQGMQPCPSLALQRFWSRGAVLWGSTPVRFDLRPAADAAPALPVPDGPDRLKLEFAARLATGDVRYRLALQPYVDEEQTPIEDGSVEWLEAVSPPQEVATLVIPGQDLVGPSAEGRAAAADAMAFNPWNAPAEFRPLGNLNRARRIVYATSAQRRKR